MFFPDHNQSINPARDQAVPPEISARLNLLTSLADSLAKHQEALVTAAGPGYRHPLPGRRH